jgi:hypothetical protein
LGSTYRGRTSWRPSTTSSARRAEVGSDLGLVMKEIPLTDGSGTVPVQFQYSNSVAGPEGPIQAPHVKPSH